MTAPEYPSRLSRAVDKLVTFPDYNTFAVGSLTVSSYLPLGV